MTKHDGTALFPSDEAAGEFASLRAMWARGRDERQRLPRGGPVAGRSIVDPETIGPGIVVVTPGGVLDAFTAVELSAVLAELFSGGVRGLIVDLSQTTLVDSSGLGAILGAYIHQCERSYDLVLVAGDPTVMRGFALTGLDRVIPTFTNRRDAIARCTTS
jgi:anti-sigma B factor antagonist